MNQQWVVWTYEKDGWCPSEAMSHAAAVELAESLKSCDEVVTLRPAHSVTRADVVNG